MRRRHPPRQLGSSFFCASRLLVQGRLAPVALAEGPAQGVEALLDGAEQLKGQPLGATDEQGERGGAEQRGVQRKGADGAALAGAARAEHEDAGVVAQEEVALPGIGLDALGAQDERGVEGEGQVFAGGEHPGEGSGVAWGWGRCVAHFFSVRLNPYSFLKIIVIGH
jgi:hypothetical protein